MPKNKQTITSPPTWIDGTRWNGSTEKVQLIRPATLLQSGLIQFCWNHAHHSLIYLFLADVSGTQCGLVLLWPICFKLWRVVHSEKPLCIPFYCCLSISSKPSTHSSLTSAVIKEFLSKEPALTFFFLLLFRTTHWDDHTRKFQAIISFWKYSTCFLHTNNRATLRVTYITFLPHSDTLTELQQILLTMFIRTDICCNEQLSRNLF